MNLETGRVLVASVVWFDEEEFPLKTNESGRERSLRDFNTFDDAVGAIGCLEVSPFGFLWRGRRGRTG